MWNKCQNSAKLWYDHFFFGHLAQKANKSYTVQVNYTEVQMLFDSFTTFWYKLLYINGRCSMKFKCYSLVDDL